MVTVVGSLAGGVAVLSGATPAGAITVNLYVSPYGSDTGNNCKTQSNPCQTLSHANNVSKSGYTINLAPGTYKGNINVVNDISIVGVVAGGSLNANTTTIDAEATSSSSKFGISDYAGSLTISNVVIDGANYVSGGIFLDGGDLTLTNVVIEDNLGLSGGIDNDGGDLTMTGGAMSNNGGLAGGGLFNNGDAVIKNVSFTQNNVLNPEGDLEDGEGGAIFNEGNLKLEGTNPIHNNQAFDGGGIEECAGATISQSSGTSDTGNSPNDLSKADPFGYC
jgi:hypothetical protein